MNINMNIDTSIDYETNASSRPTKDGPLLISPGGTMRRPQTTLADILSNSRTVNSVSSPSTPAKESQVLETSESLESLKISESPSQKSRNTRELFGGAMSFDLPSNFHDISSLRQVPDHQEVFMDQESDASIVLELLSYEDSVSHEDVPKYYFDDLVTMNKATSSEVYGFLNIPISDNEFVPSLAAFTTNESIFPKSILIGQQIVNKKQIAIVLITIRLVTVATDLLLSLNIPLSQIDGFCDNSAESVLKLCLQKEYLQETPLALHAIALAAQSLKIHDWSLFA